MTQNFPFTDIRRWSAWFLVLIVLTVSGCRLTYLFHAASGQFRLLNASVPIEKALTDESLSSQEKERLRLVAEVKSYGENVLGLKPSENYQTVYLKSEQRPIYVIAASPKDRLILKTWWFPVVGRVPYLSFFDTDRAAAEKEKLIREDLDVTMGMAEAYSTLGWFKDPVTLNLLQGPTVDLVETILHEMTHTTLYVNGQGAFNEGLAQLVGVTGAHRFLEATYGPSHPLTRKAAAGIEDERIFCDFLNQFLGCLEGLYQSDISYKEKVAGRERVFARFRHDFDRLKPTLGTDRFTGFGGPDINNAYLMAIALYHKHFMVFEAVLQNHQNDVQQMLAFFRELARQKGDMLALTARWLAERSHSSGPRPHAGPGDPGYTISLPVSKPICMNRPSVNTPQPHGPAGSTNPYTPKPGGIR
jgi:predicted aminopeptidase